VFLYDKSIRNTVYIALKNASKWDYDDKKLTLSLKQFEILYGDLKYDLVTKII
jgi:hypothetical protein